MPTGRDALLPAALLALATAELALSGLPGRGVGIALAALACAALVWRRVAPLVVAPVVGWTLTAGELVEPALSEPAAPIALIVLACYSCARYRADLWGIAAVGLMLTSALPRYLVLEGYDVTDVFFVGALLVPPYVFGRVTRRLDDQARQLAEQSEALQRQAVQEERDRIARELHDVIAHSVSAMVVQTAAAQDLVRADPDGAAQVLEQVASTGRKALAETARLLHLVRDDGDELGLAPVPGLADLDDLVADDVALSVSGDLAALPAAVDVSAYRIVQEALTNARRHGRGPVALSVARSADELRISASNAVGPPRTEGGGLGLLGMAERASVLGGRLTHGVLDERFELEAVLPL